MALTAPIFKLIDSSGHVVAPAHVVVEDDRLWGGVNLQDTPAGVRAPFDEFEEIVNGQMLSFLDEIQQKIALLSLKAVFADGTEAIVEDSQVYPSTGDVSFRPAEAATQSAKSA